MEIRDLSDAPEFFALVADRIWNAWWRPGGAALPDVEEALRAVVSAGLFPFTLVASEQGRFAGTVTAIERDIPARPDIGPCIAALWVEPEARGQKTGRLMTKLAMERLRLAGYRSAYLGARPALRSYYVAGGWTLCEEQVGSDGLDLFHIGLECAGD